MTKIDKIDELILQELQLDGRISNVQLADRVNLSPSACLRRVQHLESQGYIQGYRAIIDRKKIGSGFVVLVGVGLSRHLSEDQAAFERAVANAPEVIECHNITGQMEYMLRVEVADIIDYKRFHDEILGNIEQVSSIESFIVMESSKDLRS